MLSLTGVLLAAFVPTFLKHVRTSKLAEATELLASLHRHAASYYEAGHTLGMPLGRHCLPESAGPFPLEPSRDPVSVDFRADEHGRATWAVLGERDARELRYSYEVIVPEPGCRERANGAAVTFRAIGDLDGDGNHSLLERSAGPTSDRRALAPRGPLRVVSRSE